MNIRLTDLRAMARLPDPPAGPEFEDLRVSLARARALDATIPNRAARLAQAVGRRELARQAVRVARVRALRDRQRARRAAA